LHTYLKKLLDFHYIGSLTIEPFFSKNPAILTFCEILVHTSISPDISNSKAHLKKNQAEYFIPKSNLPKPGTVFTYLPK